MSVLLPIIATSVFLAGSAAGGSGVGVHGGPDQRHSAELVAWVLPPALPVPASADNAVDEGRAAAAEPALPAGLTPGFDCVVPAETDAGVDMRVTCSLQAGLDLAKVTLRFRPAGRFWYFAQVMVKAGEQRWQGTLPGHMLVGRAVHLYVEVANRAGVPVMTWSTKDSPQVTMIHASSSDEPGGPPAPIVEAAEENPLEETDEEEAYRYRRLWAGLGIGDGIGWSFQSPPAPQASPAPSLDVHLAPEVGCHLGPRLAVAVAGRHQFIQQPLRGGAGTASAHLGLFRVLGFSGTGRHRMFLAAMLGAGSGFRLVVSQDAGTGAARSTVRGGPFVAGASIGYVGDLARSRLGFMAEAGGLGGLPDQALVLDIRLGLLAYF